MVVINRDLDNFDKINLLISILILLSLIGAIIWSVFNADYWIVFISSLALILAMSPTLLEWRYKIDIPTEFELIAIVFVYSSLFLGETQQFYQKFWFWDKILHAGSGIALGFVGFAILYILYANKKLEARPITIAIFTFSFALALGAIWEIFEFTLDQTIGLNLQKSGLVDTMFDLIVDAGGALVAALLGFFYLKGRRKNIIDWLVYKFVRKNPHLFENS